MSWYESKGNKKWYIKKRFTEKNKRRKREKVHEYAKNFYLDMNIRIFEIGISRYSIDGHIQNETTKNTPPLLTSFVRKRTFLSNNYNGAYI